MTVEGLKPMKTFTAECPLNSAAILPGKPYVLCGGGQEAMSVTTTSARQGHFEVRVWHRCDDRFSTQLTPQDLRGGAVADQGRLRTVQHDRDPPGRDGLRDGRRGWLRAIASVRGRSVARAHRPSFDPEFFKSRPFGPIEDEIVD